MMVKDAGGCWGCRDAFDRSRPHGQFLSLELVIGGFSLPSWLCGAWMFFPQKAEAVP